MQQKPGEKPPEAPGIKRGKPDPEGTEPVWTYRGYRLKTGEFTTAMVHLFRAEVQRANVWRQRLDTTTNWAVVSTGAVISFAFTGTQGHHALVLLSFLLVTVFLLMEARRYRYYELWSYRVRLMETEFFSSMLVQPFTPSPEWAANLSETLNQPQFTISMFEAFGRRLRRNYLAIFAILFLAWLAKLWLHPTAASTWEQIVQRANLGGLSGEFVWIGMLVFWIMMLTIAFLTIQLHESSGEVLAWNTRHVPQQIKYVRVADGASRDSVNKQREPSPTAARKESRVSKWLRMGRPKVQVMALIVTDKPNEVAKKIMTEMQRGLTGIPGKGMYSGEAHHVLLCALGAGEVNRLKLLVAQADRDAFVIILSAHEILGKGFVPLSKAPS
jgi:uncharacterized membrane protein